MSFDLAMIQWAGNPSVALGAAILVLAISHLVGRLLKRKAGVKLGITYQVFALTIAILVGTKIYGHDLRFSREIGAVAYLTGAFVLTALVNRYFWELYFIRSGKPPAPKFFSQVFSLVVVLAAFVLIVTISYNKSSVISTVLTTGGVLALTIGLALQDLLGNIIAGFTIHFGRPFKLGDWLVVDGTHVEVMEINWRSTRCRTNDDTYLDIPNAGVIKQTVMNLYYPDSVHALRFSIGLDYETPPNLAKDCLLHAAYSVPEVLRTPAPHVYLIQFGDSTINYELKYFIKDHSKYPAISDAIRTNIWYELKRKKLTIPFPQRVLHVKRGGTEKKPDLSGQIISVLKRQNFFSFLTVGQLRHLAHACEMSYFGKGENIIEQGRPGESMFVILIGQAGVYVEHDEVSTQVAVVGSGDCFGEMSLLTGENRSATVRAMEDCHVAELCKDTISHLLKENPRVVEKLGELLAERKLANEGLIAKNSAKSKRTAMVRDYKATFLGRLKSFFEL